MKIRNWFVLLSGLFIITLPIRALAAENPTEKPISVSVKNRLVDIEVKNASFKDVLREVGVKAGVKVVIPLFIRSRRS